MQTTIITGASDNHFKSLCKFLDSLYKNADIPFNCYVYDLDLNSNNKDKLVSSYPNVLYRKFDYSQYPAYFNIHIAAGEYAWKPVIINEIANEVKRGVIIWCDAGNLLLGSLKDLVNATIMCQIYSPISCDTVSYWTHPGMLQYFKLASSDKDILNQINRNAAIMGFYLNIESVGEFLNDFATKAQIKECIAPEGSNRNNHRQDQALFTILYYQYCLKNRNLLINKLISVTNHNDCD